MNGCVNFLLLGTMPNKQGAHCNPSGHLTQIEHSAVKKILGKPITMRPTLLLPAVCLTHETCKQDNGTVLVEASTHPRLTNKIFNKIK